MAQRRAILSVSDKTGLVAFARGLKDLNFEILSTGGTAKALAEEGIAVTKVSEATGFPEILQGRVKTLHPKILGGVLGRPTLDSDKRDLDAAGIAPVELVCVNLYPFVQTVARGAALAEAIENIDIGGPTMIRAAAKNHAHVLVVVDPLDYHEVLEQLQAGAASPGGGSLDLRFRLARKAFAHTAAYDGAISEYLHTFDHVDDAASGKRSSVFSRHLHLHFVKEQDLRYGENPHQRAAYYRDAEETSKPWDQLQGKELSFNNLLDAQAAWAAVREFKAPAAVIVKHTNPCGVAWHPESLKTAYLDALSCDPTSAFGGIAAFNRVVGHDLVLELEKLFLEVILAPDFTPEVLAKLAAKKNLRLLRVKGLQAPEGWDFRRLWGGLLVQDWDIKTVDMATAKLVTKRAPTPEERSALDFAWKVARHVKSNAIVLAKDRKTIGIGAGQMSRVDSSRLAQSKAQSDTKGSVMASDAFFPFRDGIDTAAKAGVTAVVQPGGSVRDEEVIAAANEHGMAMLFTDVRHFKH